VSFLNPKKRAGAGPGGILALAIQSKIIGQFLAFYMINGHGIQCFAAALVLKIIQSAHGINRGAVMALASIAGIGNPCGGTALNLDSLMPSTVCGLAWPACQGPTSRAASCCLP
jgi:hypothetical protein